MNRADWPTIKIDCPAEFTDEALDRLADLLLDLVEAEEAPASDDQEVAA